MMNESYELISNNEKKNIKNAVKTLLFEGSLKSSKNKLLNNNTLMIVLKYPEEFKKTLRNTLNHDYNNHELANTKIDKLQKRLNAAFRKAKAIPFSCLFFSNKQTRKTVNNNKKQLKILQNEIVKARYKSDDEYQKAQEKEIARIHYLISNM
ncbi:MAG: hypothetical protein PVI75_07635 [Gammaproteobacteria bacterium]